MLGIGGIAVAVNLPNAAEQVNKCLHRLQHRGQDILGITSVNDGQIHSVIKTPCEGSNFQGFDFANNLPGQTAIGYCSDVLGKNATSLDIRQPRIIDSTRFGTMAIAFSGKGKLNANSARADEFQFCCTFGHDPEFDMIVRMLLGSRKEKLIDALLDVLPRIPTAYSLVILTANELFAARDPRGVFPLNLGRLGDGFIICSEDVALKQSPKAKLLKEIAPGEIIHFQKSEHDYRIRQFAKPQECLCAMECIHVGNPATTFHKYFHEDFRQELGRQLGREYRNKIKGRYILPVMLSGKDQGTGVADELGIPYCEYFKLDENRPRSRNRPLARISHETAWKKSHQKMILRKDKISGSCPIVIDGIMISSMNMLIINERLRAAGAKHITNCITAPAVTQTCPFGMEHSNKNMLVAHERTIDEIKILIGADALFFLSLAGLQKVLSETYHSNFCTGCFGGEYP